MDTVVSEPWIAFDPRFFSEDVIILALKVSDDLREAARISTLIALQHALGNWGTNLASLSI